jgi:N-acetylglucosaminyldiphosphoundecaprenol N-acetyl-beta-D-mannosaminyltransferase
MPRIRMQGIPVDAFEIRALLDRTTELVKARGRSTITYVNVHVLNVAADDAALVSFLESADVCFCDGDGVVLGARLLGETLPGRMTGADWIWDLAAHAEREGWRLAWVGGEYGVSAAAARALRAKHPRLQFVATHHGYTPWTGPRHEALIASLNAARPDVVFVGMGTPLQERWVAANREAIAAPVVWCLGATADFVSGKVSRGPSVLHQNQEWIARLLVDPRRLWKRYLVGNPLFLLRMLRERRHRP